MPASQSSSETSSLNAPPEMSGIQVGDELPEAPPSVSRGERDGISRALGFVAVVALLVTGTATFLILVGLAPLAPTNKVVTTALLINSVLVAALVFLIARDVWIILQARRKGRAAARLHVRIVGLFAIVAAVPAILVAIVASITLNQGLDRWFEQRTRQIVGSSVNVARAYMDESRRVLTGNTISLAFELDRARQIYSLDPNGFRNLITIQAKGRGFLAAQLLHRDGTPIVVADVETDAELPKAVDDFFVGADTGDPVSIPPGNTNFIGAMFKLREIPDAYLYTIMALRPEVTQALRLMESNTAEYRGLESNRLQFQLAFAVLYVGVSVIVLLAAVWTGISVADRFVSPIRRLITAADEVSSGNLDVQVGSKHSEGDLKNLSDTFNNMISELRHQRDEILQAKDVIDQRARFTQAVLSGVSAAVIGVDYRGIVTLANTAAAPLLGTDKLAGRPLKKILPELHEVFKHASSSRKAEHREQVTLWQEGQERTLNVQVTQERESSRDDKPSFVITIDDITDLVSAQRSTAWSDVARRIAHEIKNPLTPIQLSAERIRRRYGKLIVEDREVFDQCTDTIIRQVNDIGRMVDEFSSFARMPKPVMSPADLQETLGEAIFMQKVAWPQIDFVTDLGDEPMPALMDTRLISQAFINIIKNAAESIESPDRETRDKGKITVRSTRHDSSYVIEFIDNGKGLPKENRQRLLEPYMTTREKGTGLGLAIVRKILEDHGGRIELADPPGDDGKGGAVVRITLPLATAAMAELIGEPDAEVKNAETVGS
jgi:two-component system, NtrC family, nitrogen regulation sensor histidine kinase NtrY